MASSSAAVAVGEPSIATRMLPNTLDLLLDDLRDPSFS
jgi:hypothetical protein